MKFFLIVNGMDAPMLQQFGCPCDRCADGRRQANVSVSLIGLDDAGETAVHVLFDVGAGVVNSLNQHPYLQKEKARLDWLCLTHWHPDHVLDINRLLNSRRLVTRRRTGQEPPLVPLWCRQGTALWLQREHSYEWNNFIVQHVPKEQEPIGSMLAPVPIDPTWDVTITPITTSHHTADMHPDNREQTVYACAGFVVETAVAKAALLWDLDSGNDWLVAPQTEKEKTAVAKLQHADYLFIDTSFWHAKPRRTTHPSFENVRPIARNLQPRQTMLMHLSGHPDEPGNGAWGWTNGRWQAEAQRVWQKEGLPGIVRVPDIGDEFKL